VLVGDLLPDCEDVPDSDVHAPALVRRRVIRREGLLVVDSVDLERAQVATALQPDAPEDAV